MKKFIVSSQATGMLVFFYAVAYFLITGQWVETLASLLAGSLVLYLFFGETITPSE